MKVLIIRVKHAKVINLETNEFREIGQGLLVFIGFEKEDKKDFFPKLFDKILNLRVFEDDTGKLNLSVSDLGLEVLIIPNFTLAGDMEKGRRPSFDKAMNWKEAKILFEELTNYVKKNDLPVKVGFFQVHMGIEVVMDGPVNLVYEVG